MKSIALLLLLLSFVAAQPQSLEARKVGLGSTMDEMKAAYGEPLGYFWNGRTYKTVPITNDDVFIVYRFTGLGNEFELRVLYDADASQSRLHPVLRVSRIAMIADRPLRASAGLDVMPGAHAFCLNYCGIRRLIPGQALLLTQDNDRSFQAWTLQIFMSDAGGYPIKDAMKDLTSDATAFVLSPYDYSNLPLTRGVKGGWPEHPRTK